MVDILALALSHGLLLIAAWRLVSRPDLDVEARPEATPPSVSPRIRRSRPAMSTGRREQGEATPDTGDDHA